MINFREIKEKRDFEYIIKWMGRSDSYLFVPSFIKSKENTVESRWKDYKSTNKKIFLIEYNGKVVGEVDYDLEFPHLIKNDKKTAWLGIVIGEEEARGKGIGRKAMEFIEQKSREAGVKRVELGCFEMNERAFELYKKIGFVEIGRIDNMTEYNGKWWQDIRMEKDFE